MKLRRDSYLVLGLSLVLPLFHLSSQGALAQEVEDPEVQEFLELFDNTVNELVNSATLFSSQDTVSSGYFKFEDSEDPDIKLDIIKIPMRLPLAADPEAKIKPFVIANLGTFHYRESILKEPEAVGEDDFSVIDSYTIEGGGGADMLLFEGFTLTPKFTLAYTRLENRFDYNNSVSQEIGSYVDGIIFNWDIDTLTYAPGVGAAYELPFEGVSLRVLSKYTFLYNDSLHSSSDLIDVSSDTSLFQNGLKGRFPLGVQVFGGELALDPYVQRSDVQGAARKGLGFDHFYEGGVDVALGTSETIGFLSEISAGTSYTWANDFQGLRIGFGAAF